MKNNKGFSLVELIVVIAIMAILAAVAIPTFAHFITKAHEASDAELLYNINHVFNIACLDNNVDIRDVIGADFDVETMTLSGVKVKGASDEKNAAIEASFDLHFGDLDQEEFYYIERLVFDYVNKEFVEYVEGETQKHKYGDGYIYINSEDAEALKNSTFGEDIDGLLDQLDEVTGLAADMAGDKLKVLFGSQGFIMSAANSLDITGDDLAKIAAELIKQRRLLAIEALSRQGITEATNPDNYDELLAAQIRKIEANAAVLYAAQCTANTPRAEINDWVKKPNPAIVKYNLKNEAASAKGLTQASLMCGMYTSYVNCGRYQIVQERQAVTAENVLWAMEWDENFKAYLNSTQGDIDLEGYLASLRMINESTKDPAAVKELLINGFADPNLKNLMGEAIQ